MALPQRLKVFVDLALDSITRGKELSRELEREVGTGVAAGWEKGAKEGMKHSSPQLTETVALLMESGMKAPAKALKKTFQESARVQEETANKIASIDSKMESMKDEGARRRARLEKDDLNWKLKTEKRAQERMLKKQKTGAEDRKKLIETHEARKEMSGTQKFKDGGDAMDDLFKSALSADNLDLKDLTKGLAGGLQKGLSSGAGMAGSMNMGGMASAMTGMAASVGAIAAPIAAVVGVLVAAYSSTISLNKGIIDNASSYDLMGDAQQRAGMNAQLMGVEYEGLNLNLKLLRTTVLNTAYDFRLTSDEVSAMIGSLNEAGLSVSEFNAFVGTSTGLMRSYASVTETAIIAQHGLGVGASEVGEFMSKAYRNLGLTLGGVQGAFGTIADQASKAGMTTKDFFAAINTAASGMALYNFRIGDTVGLFTDLVKILGEAKAADKVGLSGSFRNMGAQEKYTASMMGGKGMEAGVRASAERQATDYNDSMSGRESFISAPGLKDDDGNLNITLKSMAALSEEQYRAQLQQLKAADKTGDAMRKFATLRGASNIEKGGPGGVAAALPFIDKMGEMAAEQARGFTMTGGMTMEEAGGNQVMRNLMEELTGLSGDAYDEQARVQTSMLAKFESMEGNAGKGLGEEYFAALGRGDLVSSSTDEEQQIEYSELEKTARAQLLETRSMSQGISNTIAGLLNNIWDGVEHLGRLMTSWLVSKNKRKGVGDVRQKSLQRERVDQAKAEALGAEKRSLQVAQNESGSPKEQKELQKKIDALDAEQKKVRERAMSEKALRQEIAEGDGSVKSVRKAMKNQQDERFGKDATAGLTAEQLFKAGLTGLVDTVKKNVVTGTKTVTSERHGTSSTRNIYGKEIVSQDIKEGAFDELTVEQQEKINALLEEQKAAQEAAERLRVKEAADQLEEDKQGFIAVVSELQKLSKAEKVAKLKASLQAATESEDVSGEQIDALVSKALSGDTEAAQSIAHYLNQGEVGGATMDAAAVAAALGITGVRAAKLNTEPKDFIYSGDGNTGSITPLNSRDDFYGAMAGGAIETGIRDLMSGAGGGGGGSKTVHISINGGNEAKVYEIVKKVLTETGYGNLRSY